jgi:hypothetical protein
MQSFENPICDKIFDSNTKIRMVEMIDKEGNVVFTRERFSFSQPVLRRPLAEEKLIVAWGLLTSIERTGVNFFCFSMKDIIVICTPYGSELIVVVVPEKAYTEVIRQAILRIVRTDDYYTKPMIQ